MTRLIDLTGQVFNGIKVQRRSGIDTTRKTKWECLCHCGNLFEATGLNLKSGNTKSCGCQKYKQQRIDLSGKRFFRLTALKIERVEGDKVFWRCLCDCGTETIVSYGHLSGGHTKSCGCYMSEVSREFARQRLGGKKENHPRWRSDLSADDRARKRLNQPEWSKAVFKKDNYSCVKCGSNKKLHAHHLVGFARFPERRCDVTNGVALCQLCHREFHSKYGTTKFSRSNFFEWMEAPDPGDFSIFGNLTGFEKEVVDLLRSDDIEKIKLALCLLEREIQRRKS